MAPSVLEARNLYKEFPGVVALRDARLILRAGQTHALLGENGAGKSTLMKTIAGLQRPDRGELLLDGRPVAFGSPKEAMDCGIATIYQEFSLVPDLSIAENLFLGDEPTRWSLPSFATMRAQSVELFAQIEVTLDPRTLVRNLSVAEQQLCEIARALRKKSRVLMLDEPTAALSQREASSLFTILRRLQQDGVALLYVTHRLAEVFAICDVATVLRDGATVDSVSIATTREEELVRMMVGREVSDLYPKRSYKPGPVRLAVRNLSRAATFSDVTFEVRGGEIVGLAGLVGAGRTEVLRALFGADRPDGGSVEVDGRAIVLGDPEAAVAAGIGFLTEDRKAEGLARGRPICENIALASLPRWSRFGVLDKVTESREVAAAAKTFNVRMPGLDAPVDGLSGGNQQKVLLARWLVHGCKVLLLDEPSRGIDVRARAEIYQQIRQLADQGLALLVVSSDQPEVIGLCDRILVMAGGRIAGELTHAEATEESILILAMPKDRAVG